MRTGITQNGFEFSLDEELLDDYEFLETLHRVDMGDTGRIIDMVDMLLGAEQKARLKEHVRDERGRVSAQKMLGEITEIFYSCNEIKN